MPGVPLTIAPAAGADDFSVAAALFREYADSLGVDLCFQDFERELASLPAMYGPPSGTLLLVRVATSPAGCVGVRRLDDTTCEMKRLYVRPEFRGQGLGLALVHAALDAARALHYSRMRLDTLPSMAGARAIYARLDFYEIPPYYQNPVTGAGYFERRL